jgi:hypothetical protein
MDAVAIRQVNVGGRALRYLCQRCHKKMVIPSLPIMFCALIDVPFCALVVGVLLQAAREADYENLTAGDFLLWTGLALFFSIGFLYGAYLLVIGIRNRILYPIIGL